MDEQELVKKRLLDLSRQADNRQFVTFSGFLNLNEQNIYHSLCKEFYTRSELFGGYDYAERQMVAFIPDALCYEWNYPISCIEARPLYPKFAENFTHRDVLGAVMNLGIERNRIGDILCRDKSAYIFCEESIGAFILENLTQIRHTMMQLALMEDCHKLSIQPEFEDVSEMVASNRIDAIIARAYHLSRSEAATYIAADKVFINGKRVGCNASCESGAIVSVRGKGRFVFLTDQTLSKKGKLKVCFRMYR